MPLTTYPRKVTFGELRETGTRDVLIYCRDYRCSHMLTLNADRWPDHVRLPDIELRFVCTVCGQRGGEMRAKTPPPRMGTNA